MKKFSLMIMAVLAMGFAACDDIDENVAPPQANAQEAIVSADDVDVTLDASAADTIDLSAAENIAIADVTAGESLPADTQFDVVVEIGNDENFSRSATIPSVTSEGVVSVTAADFETAYLSCIGKSPKEKSIYVRFLAKAVNGTQTAIIGGPTHFYGPFQINVRPMPSDLVIEDNYYLLGTINGWSVATAVQFNHSGESGYDNPVFTLKVDISADEAAAGWWWKVVPESVYVTGDWGSGAYSQFGVAENGSADLEGMLVAHDGTNEPGAGCITAEGQWLITLNLEDGTYAFSSAIDNLYTPGNSNGWSQSASQMLYTNNYADYEGYAYLDGEFKFTNAPDWNHVNYGAAGEGTLSTDSGAGNLSANPAGLYWCQVNTAALTYSVTQVTTIGVIGGFNSWGASVALTPSANYLTWSGSVTMSAGDEWKFRANDGWDINLGGSLSNLTQGGDNIVCSEAGTFTITLDLSSLPYTATVVKQ
jgi:hypothetical protein